MRQWCGTCRKRLKLRVFSLSWPKCSVWVPPTRFPLPVRIGYIYEKDIITYLLRCSSNSLSSYLCVFVLIRKLTHAFFAVFITTVPAVFQIVNRLIQQSSFPNIFPLQRTTSKNVEPLLSPCLELITFLQCCTVRRSLKLSILKRDLRNAITGSLLARTELSSWGAWAVDKQIKAFRLQFCTRTETRSCSC